MCNPWMTSFAYFPRYSMKSLLFGQRPRRGRSPVEHRGTFVRSFVRPSVPPLEASQDSNPASQASNLASQASYLASQASNLASQASNLASQASNLASQDSYPTSCLKLGLSSLKSAI